MSTNYSKAALALLSARYFHPDGSARLVVTSGSGKPGKRLIDVSARKSAYGFILHKMK